MVITRGIPKAEIWRRGVGFGIDVLVAWLISGIAASNAPGMEIAQIILFMLVWAGLRVFLVYRNAGQSLGRWLMDMKLVDAQFGKAPELQALLIREGILGVAALVFIAGWSDSNGIARGWFIPFSLPLIVDLGVAFADPLGRRAIHDRCTRTLTIMTRRGFSLDLKVKRLVAEVRQRVKK